MVAQDTLEVMYYNILNYPGSTPERVEYFRIVNQYIEADIILVNEILSDEGANSLTIASHTIGTLHCRMA